MKKQKNTGILFLSFISNNVHFLLTDNFGKIKAWTTVGVNREKGVKKVLSLSTFEILKFLGEKTKIFNYKFLHVRVKGWGKNKKNVFKILKQSKLKFISVVDITSYPHNGCKISKKRRL